MTELRDTSPPRRARRAERGISLVEIVVVIAVLGVAIPPLTNLYTQVAHAGVDEEHQRAALELAENLMEEIGSKAYEDPDEASGSFGTEEGSRAAWDDVDDYDGLSNAPPLTIDGTALNDLAGLTRSVVVENVSSLDVDAATPETDGSTSMKRIRVVVSWTGGRGGELVLTTLRASLLPDPSGELIDEAASAATAYDHDDDHFHIDLVSIASTDLEIASFELSATGDPPDLDEIKLDNHKILHNASVSLPTGLTALNHGTSAQRTIEAGDDPEARIKFDDDFDDDDTHTFTLVLHFTDGSSDSLSFTIDFDDD